MPPGSWKFVLTSTNILFAIYPFFIKFKEDESTIGIIFKVNGRLISMPV